MENEILPHCNFRVRLLYERYLKLCDSETAFIMACAEGGQPEMATPVLEMKKQDQMLLMEETYKHLVPREELYPEYSTDSIVVSEHDADKKNDHE